MNRETQMKLVAILRDAMNAQGITQNDLARKIGISSGMISQAFSGKAQMREERWRMCCEICGVDFDQFMKSQQSRAEQTEPVHEEEVHTMFDAKSNIITIELTPSQCFTLQDFIEDTIFHVIRADSKIDSFTWLSDLMDAHHTLARAVTDHAEKP